MNIKYSVPMLLLKCWGYILIAIPIAYSFMYPYVKGFDKSILEAAETDGAGKFKIFRKIEFPILFPNFVSTFFQIFVIIYGEFTIVYTMQAGNYVSLSSVTNYTLNSYRMYREASAFSSLNLMIIIIFFAFSNYIVKKNKD
ncbi:MAG TPA: ABC transporter permease subunit, partial [Tepiditoga sp.]|nr:ABC transporter permease subunit [Tepiditoga sp.]